jgi:hypothetical protein
MAELLGVPVMNGNLGTGRLHENWNYIIGVNIPSVPRLFIAADRN